jgi:hypothetical protein
MACFDLGRVQRARGRLGAPLATCQHLVENTAPPGRAAMPSAGIGYVGMAEVAYQRGELDTALQHVTKGSPTGWLLRSLPPAPRQRLAHAGTLVPPAPTQIPPVMSTFG